MGDLGEALEGGAGKTKAIDELSLFQVMAKGAVAEEKICLGGGFKTTCAPRSDFAHSPRPSDELTFFPGKDGDEAIGFADINAFEDYPFGTKGAGMHRVSEFFCHPDPAIAGERSWEILRPPIRRTQNDNFETISVYANLFDKARLEAYNQ